jgi:hypothetical protein
MESDCVVHTKALSYIDVRVEMARKHVGNKLRQ